MKKKKSPIAGRARSAAVATRLREKILSGELQDGDQLGRGGVAPEFDVSRTPVKQAIRQLEAEGLIKVMANRSAVVSPLSSEEIGELFEIRSLLECEVLRLSIPFLTDADLDKADAVLGTLDRALLHDRDARVWGRMNANFHSALYARANRPHFLSLIEMINNNGERYTRLQLYLTRGFERAREEHRMLLDLCRKRDVDAACTLLEAHIRHAGLSLKDYLGSQRGDLQARAV
jgi:DNA-binding GntR family transcriptional regulator